MRDMKIAVAARTKVLIFKVRDAIPGVSKLRDSTPKKNIPM